jgi:predicted ATPase
MPIREIKVTNFKSFRELELFPETFSVVIGSNASGKSNFIQAFIFLRDIAKYGLSNAISLQGGVEYLRNLIIGPREDLSFRIVYQMDQAKDEVIGIRDQNPVWFTPGLIAYGFSLHFTEKGDGYEISRDELEVSGEFSKPGQEGREQSGAGCITLSQVGGEILYDVCTPPTLPLREEDLFPHLFQKHEPAGNRLILNTPLNVPGIPPLEWIFRGVKVYDFDPRLPKKAVPMVGKTELEKDAANLAIVIKKIIEDPEKKVAFSNLLRDMIPFIDDVAVEKFMDMSLFFTIRETYSGTHYIPATLISDGTMNITALIVALFFEERPVTIIEEPEKNIHPRLISKVVDLLRDASRKKQVIVTTHNPELIKNAGIGEIILISRDREGFSHLSKPSDREAVRTFLEQEIGIEELFVQDLLGYE